MSWLVVLLLQLLVLQPQQQQSLLAEKVGHSERQLARPPDADADETATLSDNLNSTPTPTETIKKEATTYAVASSPSELRLQVTPAMQLPLKSPATVVTRTHAYDDEPKNMESAATLDAETAGVSAETAVSLGQQLRPVQINISETMVAVPQIVTTVIVTHPTTETSKANIATEAVPTVASATAATSATAAIMPAKTKRTERTDGANKIVDKAGMKFNMNTSLDTAQSYVNATEGWPTPLVPTAIVAATTVPTNANHIAASTISSGVTSTTTARISSGKSIPIPRLLLSAGNAAQIMAKALDNPLPSQLTPSATTTASGWPVKHAAVLEGDVILGGLMMVHSREDSITCGPIMPQGGIQALEAMLYTLDQVNKQQLLPNVTLGAHLLDDCDKDTYGLEMAVDFIKGKCRSQFQFSL